MATVADVTSIAGDVIGIGTGIYQAIHGASELKKARKLLPSSFDPREYAYQHRVDMEAKGFGTGSAYSEILRQMRVQAADQGAQAIQAAGGYGGAALEGLSRVDNSLADNYGKIFSNSQAQKQYYETQYGDSVQRTIDRKFDLDLLKYTNAMTKAQGDISTGSQNIAGGVAGNTTGSDIDSIIAAIQKKNSKLNLRTSVSPVDTGIVSGTVPGSTSESGYTPPIY